jgi:hypothetical protein
MKTDQIVIYVVALLLGMLLANMLKSVCGCKVVEGHLPGPSAALVNDIITAAENLQGTGWDVVPNEDAAADVVAEVLSAEQVEAERVRAVAASAAAAAAGRFR